MKSIRCVPLLVVSLLSACGDPTPRTVATDILCVWDTADLELAGADFGSYEVTPHLTAWRQDGRVLQLPAHDTPSSSSAFASLLTGLAPAEHGLRCVTELGGERIRPDVAPLAETLPNTTVSLASVSRSHFAAVGLARGMQTWLAPSGKAGSAGWNVDEVWSAVEGPLNEALASDAPVFLVLHFSDLRDSLAREVEPSRELLEAGLARWRGKSSELDQIFAAEDKDQSLASRLLRQFSRRKEDPRREAIEVCYRAAALQHMDGILGKLRASLVTHRRLGAAQLKLDLGSNPRAQLPRGQSIEVVGKGEFKDLSSKVVLADDSSHELGSPGAFEFPERGAAFVVQLKHPQLLYLDVNGLQLGERTLGASDVALVLASRSDPWPEHAFVGPMLDFQKAGGLRLNGRVDAPAGAQVELLLSSFPPSPNWIEEIEAPGGHVEAHGLQPGVARLTGQGPLEFSMPQAAPAARLGVVLRVNGARVNGSRMRYLTRTFVTSDRLDLGFSAASWVNSHLRAPSEDLESAPIRLQLHDSVDLLPGLELLSPEERARFSGLDENE